MPAGSNTNKDVVSSDWKIIVIFDSFIIAIILYWRDSNCLFVCTVAIVIVIGLIVCRGKMQLTHVCLAVKTA